DPGFDRLARIGDAARWAAVVDGDVDPVLGNVDADEQLVRHGKLLHGLRLGPHAGLHAGESPGSCTRVRPRRRQGRDGNGRHDPSTSRVPAGVLSSAMTRRGNANMQSTSFHAAISEDVDDAGATVTMKLHL